MIAKPIENLIAISGHDEVRTGGCGFILLYISVMMQHNNINNILFTDPVSRQELFAKYKYKMQQLKESTGSVTKQASTGSVTKHATSPRNKVIAVSTGK